VSSAVIAAVASLILALGGGAGWGAFRTVRQAKAQLVAGARKLNAEADGVVIDNIQDVLRVYIDELKSCQASRGELRQQLAEAQGVVYAQGQRITHLEEELGAANEHIAGLEARLPERRRADKPVPPDVERRRPRR
jgi:peptidoglycan hydrolase CwlO-like protein